MDALVATPENASNSSTFRPILQKDNLNGKLGDKFKGSFAISYDIGELCKVEPSTIPPVCIFDLYVLNM